MLFSHHHKGGEGREASVYEQEEHPSCSHGHRSSLILETQEGGSICLPCFSNLLSSPSSPTLHVSYALSQLSRAISHPPFLRSLLSFHLHLLAPPLVHALCAFHDDSIAVAIADLIVSFCDSGDDAVLGEFVHRVSDRISSRALSWGRRQVYTLHCLGLLLNFQMKSPCAYIRDKDALVSNLVSGLRLPSEEIQGEILFVLYKMSTLQFASKNEDGCDILFAFCPEILHLSLEALMKTQSDDVRLNCVALLLVLAQRGYFLDAFDSNTSGMDSNEAGNFMQEAENGIHEASLSVLFAEAVKGPMLSSDSKVQIGTLDLILHYLSQEGMTGERIQVLVEQNIADYAFEILRLSESKDPLVNYCLQVLDLLSTAEQAFRPKLAIGFATLVTVLHYVAEVLCHPVQHQTLKLLLSCITNCPGIISDSYMEELGQVLTKMFRRHKDGDLGMHPETFNVACTIFVALIESPSSHGNSNLAISVQEASKDAVLACTSTFNKFPSQFLHSLYLLKETYAYCCEGNYNNSSDTELGCCVLDVCKMHLLPSLVIAIDEMEEDVVLGLLETFHSILLQESNLKALEFASILVSSSWFSLAFGCLGLFPTGKMKWRVYLMFSSIVDALLGNDSGQVIREAALYLPSDPIDLLFLLGQKGSQNPELLSCQSSVLLMLEISSLYDVRPADEKLILVSLEQYVLVNNDLLCGTANSVSLTQLINLYGLYRGLANSSHHSSYSSEAEKILFQLMVEKDWDFFSTRFHLVALKWLFQQEMIMNSLSVQILKFCKSCSCGTHIVVHGKNNIDIRAIAELVAAGDNFAATIFVCLLKQLAEGEGKEHEIMSVLDLLAKIINIFPAVSDQLCSHGMGNTVLNLVYRLNYFSSQQSRMAISLLVFNLLHSVHPEILHKDDDAWTLVAMKLIDHLICTVATESWTQEALLGIDILCLILHHSTNAALVEAAKAILLNTSLISVIRNAINAGLCKGAALVDHDERTEMGETLIFLLLLHYFSLRSLHVVLPGVGDMQNFFSPSDGVQLISFSTISCNDLCQLMHFGSPLVKLVSSYCLLESFTRISYKENTKYDELNCSIGHIMSVMGVLEGLIFYSDNRVAVNCGLCLSIILSWEKLGLQKAITVGNAWCRLIVEELAMSLAVPCLASKSFTNHHKSAVHVAVALLKLEYVPEWMKSVFDYPCISGIIGNLSASNMSTEMVLLFRGLLKSQYLKADQIASLNRILQACRKRMYSANAPSDRAEECTEKAVTALDDSGKAGEFLISIMASGSCTKSDNEGLLEEIEMFFRTRTEDDG